MTAPGSPNGSSALRIGGFALIGLAILAAVIGLAALAGSTGGNGDATAAPSQPSSAAPAPSSAIAAPPPATPPPTSGPTTQGQPTATAAPAAPPAGGAGAAGAPAATRVPLRVYNNSTIAGLADRAASDFRAAGWPVAEVGNYSSGIIPTSTVYFRPGTDEEAAARRLGEEYGLRSEPRFAGLNSASPGLIVIVTRDYQRR